MSTEVVVRPVRDVDAEMLGRVHATCWHEDYDTLVSTAVLENLSPRRMAELWTHWMNQGESYTHVAALVDHEIVGFAGSGPARDDDAPRERELFFIHLLDAWHGHGIGQQLFDAVIPEGPAYLWVPEANTHAIHFYERNGFTADGASHDEPFLGEIIHEIRLVR
ncbi:MULTISPECIES: GNAT family N-acetyltransferase [Microbacteriaceae]|uniref:GNAT family N-acetyltransferase n=1 Tax=Orlajensenia leifsoniae TaxID=2561933 RepID=A0A4Y9R7A1_9MICO|nr:MULTISPECIES: GNAT family N-acetyltransferase [Leifsonia]KQQ93978.1 histone acetyltransferase [Leifsonia sp. Leaf325]TFW00148.1 GNAT family N-acetyltransferase [Leifsonia flava]